MNWAAILYFALMCIGLTVQLSRHGAPREPYHGGESLISFAISCALLYFAGFFG